MRKEKGKRHLKRLAIFFLCSIALPFLTVNSHHDCGYDECIHLFYKGKLGDCVESSIDLICFAIATFTFFWAIGSLIIFSKSKNAISPFIIMILVILFAVFLALIDPSKWIFVISLLPSLILITIAVHIDSKTAKTE